MATVPAQSGEAGASDDVCCICMEELDDGAPVHHLDGCSHRIHTSCALTYFRSGWQT